MAGTDLVQRLRQRKLVQWTLAYLSGAFVVVQGLEVLSQAWSISVVLTRTVHILLLLGLALTLVLAWYHDEKGHYEGVHQRKPLAEARAGDWAMPPVTYQLPRGAGYASITEAALVNFQRAEKLQPTGKLDRQTLAALGLNKTRQAAQHPGATHPFTLPSVRPST